VDLARSGGPEAVVLREVARRVGVSATAAYRHFSTRDDLLEEVKLRALAELAESVVAALGTVSPEGDPGDVAVARFRAAATGYMNFAMAQRGLFAMAFCQIGGSAGADGADEKPAEEDSLEFLEADAYRLLGLLLDDLVRVGRMPAAKRPGAEIAAWSAVHGLTVLMMDGPLRHLSAEVREVGKERTLDVVVAGLTG